MALYSSYKPDGELTRKCNRSRPVFTRFHSHSFYQTSSHKLIERSKASACTAMFSAGTAPSQCRIQRCPEGFPCGEKTVLQRVFVAQVPHDNVSTMRWHSRNAMHQLRLHVYASVIIQRTLYTYMSLQYIESSLRLQLRGFRKLCRKGNWNVLTYRTMQACRYLFDASGVLFVIAADWKYRTIVYMQV